MGWEQVAAIIGVNIALIAALATLIVWTVSKLDTDIKSVGSQINSLGIRLDGHATRIHQLYSKFFELLKEIKRDE